jgi:hypothetical protein
VRLLAQEWPFTVTMSPRVSMTTSPYGFMQKVRTLSSKVRE